MYAGDFAGALRKLFRPLADDWLIIYNGGGESLDVATGAEDLLTVYREELFARFQRLLQQTNP